MNSPTTGPNLLILGISSAIGQTVVSHLQRRNPFGRIIGLDRHSPRLLGPVQFCASSVDLGSLLISNTIQVVMQLSFEESSPKEAIQETQKLIKLLPKSKVNRVVFLSTSRIYESSDTALLETAPLRKDRKNTILNAYLQAEQLYSEYARQVPTFEAVSIRTCPILSVHRERPLDELLEQPWIIAPPKRDPKIHFLHEDDAARILLAAARLPELRGPINAAGSEPLPLSTVAGILQKPLIHPLPFLAQTVCWLLQHVGVRHFSPETLRSLWEFGEMNTDRLGYELHVKPRYSSRQALAVWRTGYVEKRRLNWRLPANSTFDSHTNFKAKKP